MKSHLLRLQDLLLLAGLLERFLLEVGVEVPPFLSFELLELSPFSANRNRKQADYQECENLNNGHLQQKPLLLRD